VTALNVHEGEIRPLGLCLRNSGLAVAGFGDRLGGPSEEIAEYAAQVFLVFDRRDALRHEAVVPFRNSARTGRENSPDR
jgi:hypothetical protein